MCGLLYGMHNALKEDIFPVMFVKSVSSKHLEKRSTVQLKGNVALAHILTLSRRMHSVVLRVYRVVLYTRTPRDTLE